MIPGNIAQSIWNQFEFSRHLYFFTQNNLRPDVLTWQKMRFSLLTVDWSPSKWHKPDRSPFTKIKLGNTHIYKYMYDDNFSWRPIMIKPEGNGPLDERATMVKVKIWHQIWNYELSITLIYICMLPKTALLTSPDAMAASK